MSGTKLEINKIVASILLAALIAMVVGVVSNILYKPKLDVAERGYKIEIAEEGSLGKTEEIKEAPLDIPKLMAAANAENGANIIKKCAACHSFDNGGANKVGPNLWNIINSPKGKHPNFAYSKAMENAGGIWDEENLFAFLRKPSEYLPGTKMSFVGLKKPQDIADVLAYLKAKAS